MSFRAPKRENTQARENDSPHRPPCSQSWRICFCYRLAAFTLLRLAPSTRRNSYSPQACVCPLPTPVFLSFLLLGFQFPGSRMWTPGASFLMVQKPQWTWPLNPTRGGGTVHQGELGNPSVAFMQERSSVPSVPANDPPVHLVSHIAVLSHREMSQCPEKKFFCFSGMYIFRRESYF